MSATLTPNMDGGANASVLRALLKKYEYELEAASINLHNYIYNPVGVGEHPDVVEECDKLLKKMQSASDMVNFIEGHLGVTKVVMD